MAELSAIYNFEDALESGFKALLEAQELTCLVPNDEPAHQLHRPRVELFVQVGGEMEHYHPPQLKPSAYEATLTATIVSNTKPGEVGTQEHSQYRALVRATMAASRSNIALENHELMDIVETGTAPSYEGQDGYYESSISYSIKFSIKPGSWPE